MLTEEDFIRAGEYFKIEMPKIDWTVRSLVEQGTFVILGGEPKTSKTWAALEIAVSVATGTTCFRYPSFQALETGRPVFMFLLEDNQWNVAARMKALARSKGINLSKAEAMPLFLRCRKPISIVDQTFEIIKMINDWTTLNPEWPPGLIMIDPLRNAHSEDENDSGSMKGVMEDCIRMTNQTGYSVVVNHHFKKMKKGDEESPGNAMRGSSSMYGAVDGIIGMKKVETDSSNTWRNNVHTQVKAGPQARPFGLELHVKDDERTGRAYVADWIVTETFS